MHDPIRFTETQYLGRNSYGLARRLLMVTFCFIAHFSTDEREQSGGLFLLVGSAILLLSLVLVFVPCYTITLKGNELQLKPLRKKEIILPLQVIRKAEVLDFNRYHFNNPVFNVFTENEYRFYAEGRSAILLHLEAGHVFRIGARKAALLLEELKKSGLPS
ncbi:MAG: hypothetical protein JNL88_02410 [Bacteroidia bacterium]|nr:hypothetical protein [Bacteroidia bacterium]